MKRRIRNTKGNVYYALHFYPGVAEYKKNGGSFRVLVREDVIRDAGPSFAGRPVYVEHVEDVPEDLDTLRSEADGWVSESFFNEADGRHWVKFIVCSEAGEAAIAKGCGVSNCYVPTLFGPGGTWCAVDYDKSVDKLVYDHLAIVDTPRYEESLVLTPEEFKAYNAERRRVLEKLKNKGDKEMGFSIFSRTKLKNSAEMVKLHVVLPKSKRETTFEKLMNEADEAALAEGKPRLVSLTDLVEVAGKKMTVEKLLNAYNEKCKNEDDEDEDTEDDEDEDVSNEDEDTEDDEDEDVSNEDEDDDEDVENEDDDEDEDEEKEVKKNKAKNKAKNRAKNKTKNSVDAEGKKRARKMRNARDEFEPEFETPAYAYDPLGGASLGKQRYG